MVNPRLGDIHKVDHVMSAIACQKRRDGLEFVRVPTAKEVLLEPPIFSGLRADHRDVPEPQVSHPAFLESGRWRLNMRIKLKDVAGDDRDLDQRCDTGLAV